MVQCFSVYCFLFFFSIFRATFDAVRSPTRFARSLRSPYGRSNKPRASACLSVFPSASRRLCKTVSLRFWHCVRSSRWHDSVTRREPALPINVSIYFFQTNILPTIFQNGINCCVCLEKTGEFFFYPTRKPENFYRYLKILEKKIIHFDAD